MVGRRGFVVVTRVVLAAAVSWLVACSTAAAPAARNDGGADAASGADAGPCKASIDEYCAKAPCLRDWGSAMDAGRWCTFGRGYREVDVGSSVCGSSYDMVLASSSDSTERYFYDGASGSLVAVVGDYSGSIQCLAGPSDFAFPTCMYDFASSKTCP